MVKPKERQVRVLVTGGAGYIGDSVVENLLEAGHDVTVVDKLLYTDSYMRPGCEFHRLDVRSPEFFEILNDNYWDAVIHLAALVGDGACAVDPQETVEINEEFVRDLAKSVPGSTKLIFASTCSVYGANNELLNEGSAANPLSLYAGTKLNAEKFVSQHNNHVIFRLGTLFGMSSPFGRIRADLVANILTFKALDGEQLTVFGGEQWRPLVHVRDVGRIFSDAVLKDYEGTFILSQANYRILDVATSISDIVGSNAGMKITDMKFEDLRNYKVDNSKAKAAGIEAEITLHNGILEMTKTYGHGGNGRIKNPWLKQYHNAKYIKELQ